MSLGSHVPVGLKLVILKEHFKLKAQSTQSLNNNQSFPYLIGEYNKKIENKSE